MFFTLPGEQKGDGIGDWWWAGEEGRERELGLTYKTVLFLIQINKKHFSKKMRRWQLKMGKYTWEFILERYKCSFNINMILGSGDGSVHQNSCHLSVKTWVQILRIHITARHTAQSSVIQPQRGDGRHRQETVQKVMDQLARPAH